MRLLLSLVVLVGLSAQSNWHVRPVAPNDTAQLFELHKRRVQLDEQDDKFQELIRSNYKMTQNDVFSDDFKYVLDGSRVPQTDETSNSGGFGGSANIVVSIPNGQEQKPDSQQ